MSIIETIEQLRATKGSNAKIKFIAEQAEAQPALPMVLWLALNPYHTFNGHKLEPHVYGKYNETELLLTLATAAKLKGDERNNLLKTATHHIATNDQAKFWNTIINKDIDCGIGAASVNKAIPNLIDVFDIAKAEDETHLEKLTAPYFVEEKIDGSRCVCMYSDGVVTIHSSSGTQYPNMNQLKEQIIANAQNIGFANEDFVIDSELIFFDENDNALLRATSNGLATKALNGNLTPEEESRAKIIAFDIMRTDQYKGITPTGPLAARRKILEKFTLPMSSQIKLSAAVLMHDLESVREVYNKVVQAGGEGIMVKEANSLYEKKRLKTWVKIKKEFEIDLMVFDVTPHKKHDDMIGSIGLKCADSKIVGYVGTKMSDNLRRELYKLHKEDKLIGSVCTILVHEITTKLGKKGEEPTYSLYLPRFIELRNDNCDADGFERILRITKQDNLIK